MSQPTLDESHEESRLEQNEPILAEIVNRPAEQFGVPRRFGIGTILVVMGAASVLLAFLVAWGVRAPVVFHLVAFLALVAFGQAVLFQGSNPRRASVIFGAIICPVYALGFSIYFASTTQNTQRVFEIVIFAVLFSVMGPLFGYLAGGVVGGIFLLMDRWEQRFGRAIAPGHFDPFAPEETGRDQ